MADTVSKEHRSWIMSRIRSADTKPEWVLRCALHRMGFRYRLRDRRLPGRPDLVLAKYRAAVFVHGCFWHRHPGCREASLPKSNTPYWEEKFARNVERDERNRRLLVEQGWRVKVVWECELLRDTVETVAAVAAWLGEGGASGAEGGGKGGKRGKGVRYDAGAVPERRELLAVAEEKVAYRLGSSGSGGRDPARSLRPSQASRTPGGRPGSTRR